MLEDGSQTFLRFAQSQGVVIDPERLEADGRIHRADVGDQPSGRSDAAYLLKEDGSGWVLNFKAEGKPVHFRPELARALTPEEQARAEMARQALREAQAQRQQSALAESLARWESSHEPTHFPYLQSPLLPAAGLRQGRAQLLVPMLNLTDGEPAWVGMQRITWAEPGQSPDKRFVAGTPTRGAFAVIPIDGHDIEAPLRAFEAARTAPRLVMCEGIGTALAIHKATGLPVIAALSAQNLPDVARALHDQVQGRITLYADNDGERAAHKGQVNALKAARILGATRADIALPEKPNGATPPGYDARDQLRDNGPDAIRNTLDRSVPAWSFQRSHPGLAQPTEQGRQPRLIHPHLKQEIPMADQANKVRAIDDDAPDIEPAAAQHVRVVEQVALPGQTAPAQKTAFVELNSALELAEVGKQRVRPGLEAANHAHGLLNAWREAAQPARELRAKAYQDLNLKQQTEREGLFSTIAQQRAEAVKNGSSLDLHGFEAAKQIEHLQKQQAAERKTMVSGLPMVPTLREFLEPHAEHDPIAAHMLEQEKLRDPAQESIRGRRIAEIEPEVLEGLTHDIEDGPPKSVHYARDGERVMTDRGERVDLYRVDDREIESALRLAEQKFDMDKGLQLTGSREFQERAAELAGRLGLKVQNPELQQTWQLGRLQTMQLDELGVDTRLTEPAVGQGSVEAARSERPGDSRTYTVDAQAMQAEALLSKLDISGFDGLDRASRYQPLSPEQRMQLQGHDEQTRLIDDQDRLTPLGERTAERMWAKIDTERQQLQQQLRTRNIDEDLEKRQEEKKERTQDKAEQRQEQTAEKTVERAQEQVEERQIEQPQRIPQRAKTKARDQGLGLG